MTNFRKAVFLDRDGVINKERFDYVKTLGELEIFPGTAEHVKLLKNAGFVIVVITNQSAINRGLTNHENIKKIHAHVQEYFKNGNTSIDGFYYCPHRPDENCFCRKPKPGLILKAAEELNIDIGSSWLIGDNISDLLAAESAGCKAIKIDEKITLSKAVQIILDSTA